MVLHISAAHILGKEHFEADKNSRKFQDATEWQLNPKIYKAVCDTFGTPKIDSLASRINRQTEKYFSWKPEPEAFAVDLFSINLSYYFMFIFPPFSLLTKVIKKICRHQATYMNCSFSSVVNRAFVSADIGAIRLSFTKNLAKSNKFDIAT